MDLLMLHSHATPGDKRNALRKALESGRLQRFPGAFNALSAQLIEHHGFEGVYVSGAVVSADLGLPDVGLTTLSEVASRSQQVLRVTSLPGLVDADTGFGEPLNVARTVQVLEDAGVAGLHIQWAPGKTRRIPEELAPTIQAWVKQGPQSCGLDRANWTYEELATYLYQQTGIDVKRSAMQDFCQHHQIRPYRPTYRYLRGDPHQQQTAREEIEALKKSPTRPVCAAQSK